MSVVEPCRICGGKVREVAVGEASAVPDPNDPKKRVCTNPRCRSKEPEGLSAAEGV